MRIASARLALDAESRVVWSRIHSEEGALGYHGGLRFDSSLPELRAALFRMAELGLARIDSESLRIKLQVQRTRAIERGRRIRQLTRQTQVDSETVLLVRHVRQQLRMNVEEATRWYNKAKFSDADPAVREIVDMALPFREEMLAIWEYLDRSIDLRLIVRICTRDA